ncbi:MAG: mechanosensitive ion channel family protein [Bacteroidia bacterium]|nr:mechanosensitive ion channel family protein [Bacteroidia bacterium]
MNSSFPDQLILDNPVRAYLWFAGILVVGLIFKRLITQAISWIAYTLIRKYSKGITFRDFKTLLSRPANFLILVIILYFAFDQLSFPKAWHLGPTEEPGIRYSIFILFQLIVSFAVTWTILRFIDFVGLILYKRAALTETKLDDQFVPYFKSGLKVIVIIFALLVVMAFIFKMNVAALIGGLGLGGLALALASKETVENLFGSFTIFFDKPFTLGDQVRVGDLEGNVESIGLRSTRLRTLDQNLLTIPNKKMIDAELENITLKTMWRARFTISLTYAATIQQIQAVTKDISDFIQQHPNTKDNPFVKFTNFSPSSLDILIIFYVLTSDFETFHSVKEEINFKIMEIVELHNCSFAFPSSSVYVEKFTNSNQTQSKP